MESAKKRKYVSVMTSWADVSVWLVDQAVLEPFLTKCGEAF